MITSFASDLATGAVHRWAVESQQRARRNAMLAATECAQRRAEREDVEEFLSALYAASAATTDATTDARAAHG